MIRFQQGSKEGVKPTTLNYWLLGISMVCLIALCLWRNHSFIHDDTYITLRYASHLLAGFGPIWNTQGPRVEGFTSPLHMLLVTAVGATGLPWTTAARVVNFSSHLILLVFLYFYLRRRVGSLGAQLGVTIVGASWMFLIWDLGGLDAVLYATLVTIGVLLANSAFYAEGSRRSRLFVLGSLVLAFGTLARPEGFLLLCGAWVLILLARGLAAKDRVLMLAASIGVAAIVLVPVEIFRWTYFHALAPNTMYAKIGGISWQTLVLLGVIYLAKFAVTPPNLLILASAAGIFAWMKRRSGGNYAPIWMFIGLNILFIIISGGDHMRGYRFFLPVYALLTVVLVSSLSQSGLLEGRSAVRVCVVVVGALLLQTVPRIINPGKPDPAAGTGKLVGIYINTHWPQGSTVALNTAGATPFYADNMQYIDMLGLNDAQIARRKNIPKKGPWTRLVGHLKGDGASVLARRPDFIILGPAEGTTPEVIRTVFFIGDYEIAHSTFFQDNYRLCTANISDSDVLTYYERRDLSSTCRLDSSIVR